LRELHPDPYPKLYLTFPDAADPKKFGTISIGKVTPPSRIGDAPSRKMAALRTAGSRYSLDVGNPSYGG